MFSPCNCFISCAMIKNNQTRVRSSDSFDTNWRGLLNTTAAVLDFGGRSLREEQEDEEDVGTVSLSQSSSPMVCSGAAERESPTPLHMLLMENGNTSATASCDAWLCAAQRVREHRRVHGICLEAIDHLWVKKLWKWEDRWWPPQSSVEPNENKYLKNNNNKVIFLGYLLSHSTIYSTYQCTRYPIEFFSLLEKFSTNNITVYLCSRILQVCPTPCPGCTLWSQGRYHGRHGKRCCRTQKSNIKCLKNVI